MREDILEPSWQGAHKEEETKPKEGGKGNKRKIREWKKREDKREEEEVPCERILIEAIMYSLGFEGTNASPQLGLT